MRKIFFLLFLFISVQLFSQTPEMLQKFRIAGATMGNALPKSPTPRQCLAPQEHGWWQAFHDGWLYYIPVLNRVVEVKNPIFSKWAELGLEQGNLGFPLYSAVRSVNRSNETISTQKFEGGSITYNYVTQQLTDSYYNVQISPHRYRLILCGFKVQTGTEDDPMQWDGKGDEIYIRTDPIVMDRFKNVTRIPFTKTKIMGDTGPNNEHDRIRAGTISPEGGLGSGESYPGFTPWRLTYMPQNSTGIVNRLPMKIWEGEISQGSYLIVVPSVWEWDEDQTSYFEDSWTSFLDDFKDNWISFLNEPVKYAPGNIDHFSLGTHHFISKDKIRGNLPLGLTTFRNQDKEVVAISNPIVVASRQGFYFGGNYDLTGENVNQTPHSSNIFEATFKSRISPFGSYTLFLQWDRL